MSNVGDSNGSIKIFSGNANIPLAKGIVEELAKILPEQGIKLCEAVVSKFKDGETNVQLKETVRECDVFIINPTTDPVNDHLMELLIMIDAARRASAKRITAVLPYFGYSRQDRKARARDPISAKLIANLITAAGADRVLTMDLHCAQIQGFFDIPVDHLYGMPLIHKYYEEKFKGIDRDGIIIVSPDHGAVARASTLAEKLDVTMAVMDKRRTRADVSEVRNVVGDVAGKVAVIIDEEINTAGSIVNAAKVLKDNGSTEVYACCTHGKLTADALKIVEESAIQEMLVLDTVLLPDKKKLPMIKQETVARIFAGAIYRIHEGMPVSDLFN